MSDVAQVALITGGIGFASLVATLWSNARASAKEREHRLAERRQENTEWYRRTLFERRLTAIHEANAWLARISQGIARVHGARRGDERGEVAEIQRALHDAAQDAEEWLNKNLIYLYGDMPDETRFGSLLFAARLFSLPDTRDAPWEETQAASDELKSIANYLTATGAKHG